jgi:hypothetical protein
MQCTERHAQNGLCAEGARGAPDDFLGNGSWLNLVERFFAELTAKRIRRGAFKSVAELEDAIDDYLMRHNADSKPFAWTKPIGDIRARGCRALEKLRSLQGDQASESEH